MRAWAHMSPVRAITASSTLSSSLRSPTWMELPGELGAGGGGEGGGGGLDCPPPPPLLGVA